MVKVESRIEKRAAGATKTKLTKAEVKGKIVEFEFWMLKQGFPETTASKRSYNIKRLVDLGANLWDPESVKTVLALQQNWKDSYKRTITYAYESFLEMEGLTWQRPHYAKTETYPFIPTEAELDQLIAASGKRVRAFLLGLKDTGADPGELAKLRWIDINPHTRTVNLRPVKRHNPRILQVSQKFLNAISRLPKKGEYIFNRTNIHSNFYQQRKRIAQNLENPRLLKISLTTFRHWKGTMEYHKTKDVYHVKKLLGHKKLQSTEIYINIEQAMFEITSDEFHVKVAQTLEEACKLLEVGFEYVTDMNGAKLFRKRK